MKAPKGASGAHARRTRRGPVRALVATLLALTGLGAFAVGAYADEIPAVSFPGTPLTVSIGPLGQCQSSYPVSGNNYFPPDGNVGDCGFFLAFPSAGAGQPEALKGKTFGFDGAAGPFLESTYTPVSQSAVTGAGTTAAPYTQTTVFKVVDSEKHEDALITETTTYVNGDPQFTSTFNVKNTTASKIYFRAIYAGDLYVNGNDHGTGVYLAGPPRFIGGQNTGSGVTGGFQEVPAPALPWSSFQEAYWNYPFEMEGISAGDNGIWHDVETTDEEARAFNETIEPNELDNGAGAEWDQLRETGLAAGAEQSFSIINRTQVPSGLKVSPANQTLTQGQTETVTVTAVDTANQPYAGKSLHYTVSGANPQAGSVLLNAAGQAQISYVGHNVGIDTIQMYVDLGGSGSQTSSDPSATAQVTFLPAPPVPNSTYTIQGIKANSDGTITITLVPSQSGTATLTVTVPTGTIARREAIEAKHSKKCKKGQVKIKRKCRSPITVSGKIVAPGTAGVPLTLTVKPSGKVRAALKKGKTVHLTATLVYQSSLGGAPTTHVYPITVKGKRRHHKRKH